MDKRIGVYICHCGGNISDYVDVEKVRQSVENDKNIVLAKTTMFACSDANQRDMVDDIKNYNLDGVIVASCSPKLHLVTFRNVTERGNLNKYTYVHSNIREHSSWAHSDNKEGATEKAIHLVKAAIAKSRHTHALEPTKVKAEKSVAVIGAGVAGLKAALTLAEKDTHVFLIEKEAQVGGWVAKWKSLSMTDETGDEIIKKLYDRVKNRQNISVFLNSEVVANTGSIGNISLKIRQKEEEFDLSVGSVLVATGFEPYQPKEAEFGFGNVPNVITLPEFKQLIDHEKDTLTYHGKVIRHVAYIYCVGSRQPEGGNTYCSRYCCTATIHAAIETRTKFKNIQNYHFTRGVRSYGKQELLYAECLQGGDIFLQSYEDSLPTVFARNNKPVVRINDILTGGKELEVEADLIVLVTGMAPRSNNSVGSLFKLPKGRDKFFNEIHMKLRPVETVIDGVTIAGACQGPKTIVEAVNSGMSAAVKSYTNISKGMLETDPQVAKIDAQACTGCGDCLPECPFDAISMQEEKAVINSTLCKGCGMCTPVCEPDAIDLVAFSNVEIMEMIDALA
ncbi:MAG: CoB--CoM heterodisulfide reductase iron-sulfur subunit A family protein [Paludibacteraceae bacterium]